jgi:hypothetical protein
MECQDTVTGLCPPLGKEECIDWCEHNDECGFGLFRNNTCYPVRSSLRNEINPFYRMQPEVGSTAFTKLYPFPPLQANRVFFGDRVKLQNVETGLILHPSFQLRLPHPYEYESTTQWIPITTRDHIVLKNIENSLILRPSGGGVDWIKNMSYTIPLYNTFHITPTVGEDILYTSEFHLQTTIGAYVGFYKGLQSDAARDLVCNPNPHQLVYTFRFIPLEPFFTCQQNQCVDVPYTETQPDGRSRTTKSGQRVYEIKNCFYQC